MASDRMNVEAMRNKLYHEALCGQSIGWGFRNVQPIPYRDMPVRWCTILLPNEVILFTFFLSRKQPYFHSCRASRQAEPVTVGFPKAKGPYAFCRDMAQKIFNLGESRCNSSTS
ncbi:hypothetical protein TNCV_4168641 [Trichonephila clavipes]|nr:hypothetical protein TNCV_4168641 [Trichonephila clavipes]